MKTIALLGAGLLVLGCGPEATRPAVNYVPTHTPGLKYVIVGHSGLADDFGSRGNFSRSSDYLLLCDGRPVDGMHCAIPPEVGTRASFGPTAAAAPAPVPEMVGALAGATEEHVAAATPSAPSAATPAMPVAMPIVVPPPVVHVAPKVGK